VHAHSLVEGTVSETLTGGGAGKKAVDWAEEAAKLGASEPPLYGKTEEAGSYLLTGNPNWVRATEGERVEVVAAFATNAALHTVGFANAMVGETLAVEWGRALQRNSTITALSYCPLATAPQLLPLIFCPSRPLPGAQPRVELDRQRGRRGAGRRTLGQLDATQWVEKDLTLVLTPPRPAPGEKPSGGGGGEKPRAKKRNQIWELLYLRN